MVNHYKLFFSYFFIFESFVKIFGFNIYPINGKNLQKIKQVLMDPRFSESPKEKEKGWPEDKDDIFKEYENLLKKQKEMEEMFNHENSKLMDNENQMKVDNIHICLLIIIVCILAIILITYFCYEFIKYRKKKKLLIKGGSISKIPSFGNEFKSSFESSNSTNESNKKKSSLAQSQNGDLSNSSNFNILLNNGNENELGNSKKEEKIIFSPYNDGDEAPIQYIDNNINNNNNENNNINNNINNNNINNNNINNNIYNDDMKTLTNDENVYFASKTDKLLYKPFSDEEIKKK